ncbi:Npun_F0494 family protein [Trichocoleus sp. FACHB-262]|uniref:Npun_F0494 family protein n=1 Tax=Trichocoleus sp. FACHB-262 TaxID=2692869 RepID=UPI001688111B|nr:Npun_F0494 family protein [Trichocoleus sp. FACHB-262]MBD2123155.1 hypothetical protein [Trichocoleus sp. FACHB-262]
MTVVNPNRSRTIHYPSRTVKRAKQAMRCAPFRGYLFVTMHQQSVSLQAIAGSTGVQQQYTRQPLSELKAESALLWLIQVGVLRREVDGQGLTDSFRLTPLGRQIVEQWQLQGGNWPSATLWDHLYNALNRWVRLPI